MRYKYTPTYFINLFTKILNDIRKINKKKIILICFLCHILSAPVVLINYNI